MCIRDSDTTWLRGQLPYADEIALGSLDGRDQPKYWQSTKGCSYRSDFNAGDEEGPYTDYRTGVQWEFTMTTEMNESLKFRVFRSLPEWNATTDLGTTFYWFYWGIHVNNHSAPLLPVACDEDVEMVDCRRSLVFPHWNDTISAYYPG